LVGLSKVAICAIFIGCIEQLLDQLRGQRQRAAVLFLSAQLTPAGDRQPNDLPSDRSFHIERGTVHLHPNVVTSRQIQFALKVIW